MATAIVACGPRGDTGAARSVAPPPGLTPAARAQAAVATLLGIPPEAVRIVSVEARDFPDSSLDCPEPGMSYLQVITPGHQVLTEADGRRFDVRVAGETARICHRRKTPPAREGDGTNPVAAIAERARSDLARRLQTGPGTITIRGIRALRSSASLPGCELRCSPAAAQCGYGVVLVHAGRAYEYYVTGTEMWPCPPILPG